jgi:hypothetical protein
VSGRRKTLTSVGLLFPARLRLGPGSARKQAFWKNEPILVGRENGSKCFLCKRLRTKTTVIKKQQFEKRTHFWLG